MRWFLILAAGVVGGCSLPYPCENSGPECVVADEAPDQVRFVSNVWFSSYEMPTAIPEVRWILHGDDKCPADPMKGSLYQGDRFDGGDGECVFGIQRGGRIYAMAFNGDWELGRGTAAHELLHAMLGQRYGNGDADHNRPEWSTLLPAAIDHLRSLGIAVR